MKINTKPFYDLIEMYSGNPFSEGEFVTLAFKEIKKLAEAVNSMLPEEETKLLNCPICNSEPYHGTYDTGEYRLECLNCCEKDFLIRVKTKTKQEAIAKWNTRK